MNRELAEEVWGRERVLEELLVGAVVSVRVRKEERDRPSTHVLRGTGKAPGGQGFLLGLT